MMNVHELERFASVFASLATGIGVLVALVFGIFEVRAASRNQQESKRSNQMQALISFDQMLENYHHIHTALRPGGDLCKKEALSHQERVDIERYMGLFERAKVFLDDNYLTVDRFKNLYGYRMHNLANQPWVRKAKLIDNHKGWAYFLMLYKLLYPKDYERIKLEATNKAEPDDARTSRI
jgi:hypothetical protein